MSDVLTAQNLRKDYGQFQALRDLSIHVPRGCIYGLVGRNGAGKTTLIRIVCGLQRPTAGSYALYGVDSGEGEIVNVRRHMGAMVEGPSVYLDLTAEENLREQFRVLGKNPARGIRPLLELVGLEGTGRKKVRHFSLGMRQRLGIAVALAGSPDFLILDEPMNGLDPQGIVEIRQLIQQLNRERGITMLISSHILDELSKVATHYGFLDNGRMLEEVEATAVEGDLEQYYMNLMEVGRNG